MKAFRNLICLTLIAAVASGAAVADEKKAREKGNRKRKAPGVTQRFVGKMDLSDEQKEQAAAIDKQFAERFMALNKIRTASS